MYISCHCMSLFVIGLGVLYQPLIIGYYEPLIVIRSVMTYEAFIIYHHSSKLASGKQPHNYGKIHSFLVDKSTISTGPWLQ